MNETGKSQDIGAVAVPDQLDAWIEREFSGHGLAVRRKEEPPIPGEPLMSMAVAKDLVRRAVREERERCAKIADFHFSLVPNHREDQRQMDDLVAHGYGNAAINIAAEIRRSSRQKD